METNEVQWHPPEQLLSAAPDTQTAGDDQLAGIDGEEKCEQGDLEDKDDSEEAKGDLEIQIAAAMCLQVYYVSDLQLCLWSKFRFFSKIFRKKLALYESSSQ